jgi:NADPH:quinone reductase-like Zn-dependent oxidoreductase
VIRDNIGGSYLQRNLNNLGVDGRLFIIGFQGGIAAEVNLQAVLARRLTIQGILVAQAYMQWHHLLHFSDAQ